jgi:hypothetical protein
MVVFGPSFLRAVPQTLDFVASKRPRFGLLGLVFGGNTGILGGWVCLGTNNSNDTTEGAFN